MEGLMTPAARRNRQPSIDHDSLALSSSRIALVDEVKTTTFGTKSPEGALESLKSQPDYATLTAILQYLWKGVQGQHAFDVLRPTPQAAQIVHVLVTEIVPNYWAVLQESTSGPDGGELSTLGVCLQSLSGINASLAFLRIQIKEARLDPTGSKGSPAAFNLAPVLGLLHLLLDSDKGVRRIWERVSYQGQDSRSNPLRQELVTLLAGGKIVSLCAESSDILRHSRQESLRASKKEDYWAADPKLYTQWLGRNLVSWMPNTTSSSDLKICAELFTRATRLGQAETLFKMFFSDMLINPRNELSCLQTFLGCMGSTEQRKILFALLKLLSGMLPDPMGQTNPDEVIHIIGAAAGALKTFIGSDTARQDHLISWLTGPSEAGIGEPVSIRRAALACLAEDKDAISRVLERTLGQFGDQLYIKHSPVLQQEAHAQVILLAAGYTQRLSPIKLTMLCRSSAYMTMISNRLGALQSRVRFLGMVVGEALSSLVHGKETRLNFQVDDMETEDAKLYKKLVHISDRAGSLDPLREKLSSSSVSRQVPPVSKPQPRLQSQPQTQPKSQKRTAKPPAKTGFIIEEVQDDDGEEEAEEAGLIPHAKPDSDAEDSDDDPTLISRDKPRAPVYIRDLINYFRDSESYDKHKIALETAPTLIRRKANFGTEVTSHAEELASIIMGLQDTFELEGFHDMRIQGMVAVVIAQPKKMGPWFAKTFFDGDYSIAQRASILIVLGLSGREIAGAETSKYKAVSSFPSKALPPQLEYHYTQAPVDSPDSLGSGLKSLPANAVDNLAQSLAQTFLAPLAAEAADAATGPDALKLATFTSRLPQPKETKGATSGRGGKRERVRAIPNTTAALLSSYFFLPLTARFQAAMRSRSAVGLRGIIFDPYLLSLYLKTLALLLHAAGPSTLSLPQMTNEFWGLLLSVRGQCPGEIGVSSAILFGLVALLDVHEGNMRGLCERHGREVVESSEWANEVFHNTRGGDQGGGGEENELKMLAAGVLIRLREAVDKYQAVLMGDMLGMA